MTVERDMLSPREVAERVGLSYHAVLRAIKRGALPACEPVPGRLRVDVEDYERWRRTPARTRNVAQKLPRSTGRARRGERGYAAELKAVEEAA